MRFPTGTHATRTVGALVIVGVAFSAMAASTWDTRPTDHERIFIDEATRSASMLTMLGRLAVQEGDAQSTRQWGAMLEVGQESLLQQLHAAGGKNTSAMHVTPTAHDQHVIDGLATWRSHWFDRRILAAVVEQQRRLLSTLEAFSNQRDHKGSEMSRFAAGYAEQLRGRIDGSLTLLSAAGADPPVPQGPSRLHASHGDSGSPPATMLESQVLTVKSQDQ